MQHHSTYNRHRILIDFDKEPAQVFVELTDGTLKRTKHIDSARKAIDRHISELWDTRETYYVTIRPRKKT